MTPNQPGKLSSRHRGSLRLLAREQLEPRLYLSGISFATHNIVVSETIEPQSVYAADLDGDGDTDILSASQRDNKIAWYENVDGKGSFGPQRIITTDADGAKSVYAADLDGDGDTDILSASSGDNKIAWYENVDGDGSFGPQQVITTDADWAKSVYAADLDGDGDMDVLSASGNDDKIAWYENTDGKGSFGEQQIITAEEGGAGLYATDLDGDGDVDVLSGGISIAWYENTDGKGRFGPPTVVIFGGWVSSYWGVYASDLDDDGDMDLLSTSGKDIAWYENTDGRGNFGKQQIITAEAGDARSVYATDLDGDGDMDVLSAGRSIAWYENTDGKGSFGEQQIITAEAGDARSVYATDLDGDGDMDVLWAGGGWRARDTIAWYENDGSGNFGEQNLITRAEAQDAYSVFAGDLDGDGDMDVLSASRIDRKIAWYENTDGKGSFGEQQIITSEAGGARSVYAADVDGDGDMDVLSAAAGHGIHWYENTDGKGRFGPPTVAITRLESSSSYEDVYASDLDGDGDMDLLSAGGDAIAWYPNTDGQGTFGEQQVITTPAGWGADVYATDLDGDGDMDVLSARKYDLGLAWYENTDGKGSFGEQQIITPVTLGNTIVDKAVYATDLDGDGDVDVLSGGRSIAWYDNTDGRGNFGSQQVIRSPSQARPSRASSVYASDIDGDGDVDVLSASSSWLDGNIAWYENTDGKGSFGEQQVITAAARRARSVYATDLDGDGDMDVLSASSYDSRIAWYENLGSVQPGDANEDGQFDQTDITVVLEAGKYLTGEAAEWSEGDWNADELFDQLDIVAALQTGNYQQGPYAVRDVDAALAATSG